MSYTKHNFQDGDVLCASQLNEMDGCLEEVAQYVDSNSGVYELIETITFDTDATFTRNKEPDGTPYAFKKVCVRTETPAASLAGGYVGFRHGSTVVNRAWIPALSNNTSKRHMLTWCEVKDGYWDVTDSDWATDRDGVQRREYHIDYFMKYAEKDYPTITDVRTAQTHVAGTVITIWGVRA